ncbi:MAG: hypothetical protein AAB477_01380 [Patescibacteria group bacterium]
MIKIARIIEIITFKKYFSDKINVGITSRLAEYNQNYSKYLITLSSSAVGLTFVVLKFFETGVKNVLLLKISWCFFGTTILFGLMFHIIDILRVFHHARSELIYGDGKTLENDPDKTFMRKLNDEMSAINKAELSYTFLILQTVVFFIAIILLTLLMISNF